MTSKNSSGSTTASSSNDRALTASEYAAAAMLLAATYGGNLWYDSLIHAYRPRSPAGHAYKYSGCIDAVTLEPLGKGEALNREREAMKQRRPGLYKNSNKGNNTCTTERLGFPYEQPQKAPWQRWL